MLEKFIKIASKIAYDFMNEKEAFDMTEREWEEYSKLHPNAKKENHNIIPVPGKHHKDSDFDEYFQRETKAKVEYFQKMKEIHPNYIPIVRKETMENIIWNGEYSVISAGVNGQDPEDVEKCKNPEFVKKRHEELRRDLDKLGVKYTEVVGNYGDGEEMSFMVSTTLDAKVCQKKPDNCYMISGNVYETDENIIKKLNNLGKKYNQNSVAHSKGGIMEWHFTTGENEGGKIVTGTETYDAKDFDMFYSEGRITEDSYIKWSADVSKALDDNGDIIKENIVENKKYK
jgi:hypothetical protein